jgi:iron complex outermembrane receptor protein
MLLMLIPLIGYSQQSNKSEIQLMDQEENTPIHEVKYTYGDQSGVSDENGLIYFTLTADDTMELRHPDYGEWTWTKTQLEELAVRKVFYRKNNVLQLFPVTVIAVKPDQQPTDKVSLDYQAHMAHDGAAILEQIPAFSSIRKGGNYGNDPVFRGYKYDQLNIVMNGAQSATAACPNRMDPPTSQMSPNMIDRVEVLKGPHALRYGSGFGATINFLPPALRFSEKLDVYGRVSGGFESNGLIKRSEGQIGLSTKRVDFNILGAWASGNDYLTGNRETVQSDFTRSSFGANLGVKLSEKHQLRLSSNYNIARDADFPALPMDLREDDTYLFSLRHDADLQRKHLKNWNTTIFGSFVQHLMDNGLKPDEGKMVNAVTDATTRNYGGRSETKWRMKNSWLYAGVDFRAEEASGVRTREFIMGPMMGNVLEDNVWQDGSILKYALFGEYKSKTEAFSYVISTRIEHNMAQIDDVAAGFLNVNPRTSSSQINPSISFGMNKSIDHSKFGVWLGRVQRSGSLTERFINFFPVGQDPYELVGNPDLAPEVNNQLDLTYTWEKKKTMINVDIFGSYLQDMILSSIDTSIAPKLPMSPGVRRFSNIESGFKTGFEIEWAQELVWNMYHNFSVAYTYAQDLSRNEPLPEIPPLDIRYTLRGNYLKEKLHPKVSARYVATQDRISLEYGETVTPDFVLLDLGVEYVLNKYIRLGGGVNNLLDENYYEHLNRSVRGTPDPIYAMGRNFFVNVSVSF